MRKGLSLEEVLQCINSLSSSKYYRTMELLDPEEYQRQCGWEDGYDQAILDLRKLLE